MPGWYTKFRMDHHGVEPLPVEYNLWISLLLDEPVVKSMMKGGTMSDNPTTPKTPKYPVPEGETYPYCNPDQLAVLKRCSIAKDMTEWKVWREKTPDVGIWLQGAKLRSAHLEGADLHGAHLEMALLRFAHLEDANLHGALLMETALQGASLKCTDLGCADMEGAHLNCANMKRARMEWTNLKGVHLEDAYLEGASFVNAYLDSKTTLHGCQIDKQTNFSGANLDVALVDPGMHQSLQYNIRRLRWRKEWSWKTFYRPRSLGAVFWWMMDYGYSTTRIVFLFVLFSLLFANLYQSWPKMIDDSNTGIIVSVPLRHLYFSVVTMTTLGFGDIAAAKGSVAGHFFIMGQVILGYLILGALITRFGVVFQADGPPVGLKKTVEDKQWGWGGIILLTILAGVLFGGGLGFGIVALVSAAWLLIWG